MKYLITEKQYNFLNEQSSYEKGIWDKSSKFLDKMSSIDPHTLTTITQIATAFIPMIGPFISMGIGLADAALYLKEGDKKTAGLMGIFAMIPAIGGLASKLGLGKWSAKALGEIGKKISLGSKLTPAEVQVANRIAQYRQLIQTEMSKVGNQATIQSGKKLAKQQIVKSNILKGGKKLGGEMGLYSGIGYGYDKAYNKIKGPGIDLASVDSDEISQTNKQAALELKFD